MSTQPSFSRKPSFMGPEILYFYFAHSISVYKLIVYICGITSSLWKKGREYSPKKKVSEISCEP